MTRPRHAVTALAAMLLTACGGTQNPPGVPAAECARHTQCDGGRWCVEAQCVRGSGEEPVDADAWFVEGWFVEPGYDSCGGDEDCGPWVCGADARCEAPGDAGRELPARSAFAYWDTSCQRNEHCPDDWVCAREWCTPEDHLGDPMWVTVDTASADEAGTGTMVLLGAMGGDGGAFEDVLLGLEEDGAFDELLGDGGGLGIGGVGTGGGGAPCVADTDCFAGEDCVAPGYCLDGYADMPMTWVDVYDPTMFRYGDESCTEDADCGGWICDVGYCEAPEFLVDDVPLRNEVLYYDGSCSLNDDCGPWVCDAGWCRDPDRIE